MPRQEKTPSQVQMDATHLWQTVLGDLQARVSATAFDNWLRQTSLVGFADDVATVAAPLALANRPDRDIGGVLPSAAGPTRRSATSAGIRRG